MWTAPHFWFSQASPYRRKALQIKEVENNCLWGGVEDNRKGQKWLNSSLRG
jgi:hypothetical protein